MLFPVHRHPQHRFRRRPRLRRHRTIAASIKQEIASKKAELATTEDPNGAQSLPATSQRLRKAGKAGKVLEFRGRSAGAASRQNFRAKETGSERRISMTITNSASGLPTSDVNACALKTQRRQEKLPSGRGIAARVGRRGKYPRPADAERTHRDPIGARLTLSKTEWPNRRNAKGHR